MGSMAVSGAASSLTASGKSWVACSARVIAGPTRNGVGKRKVEAGIEGLRV